MTAGAFSQHALERETRAAAPPPGLPPQHSIGARHRFVDRPLNETIYLCFAYGQGATAERLRTELKVPERRWWRLKLKGLAYAHAWGTLWADLGSSRRSPIGFKPFADACLEHGAYDEAAKCVEIAAYL